MMDAGLVHNPPWVTKIVAQMFDHLGDYGIPPQWYPKISGLRARGNEVTAHLKEYGCGAYGCVFPTFDDQVVLKVTADDTEAEFAADLANRLVRPICVHYEAVIPTGTQDERGSEVYLLWRESADYVGRIDQYLDEREADGARAIELINEQHQAGQEAFSELYNYMNGSGKTTDLAVYRTVARWLNKCEAMARQTEVPTLRALGEDLVQVYNDQQVLFGDIHSGNLGFVKRRDGGQWVITDPGHVAVVNLPV